MDRKKHFLVMGHGHQYYRACDSFCYWLLERRCKFNELNIRDVTCKRCRNTKVFKKILRELDEHR